MKATMQRDNKLQYHDLVSKIPLYIKVSANQTMKVTIS
jgi:hypothetical protein